MAEFTYINTEDALNKACGQWNNSPCVGVDLECENNLHNYGTFISIIQLSTKDQHWVIDVLGLKHIQPTLTLLENPSVQKIFHDISFDLRILHKQFNCRPRNIFDTQVAAHFVGETEVGLGSLLKRFFDVNKERRFQMADWTKRPLSEDMLEYAVKDTMYLIQLRDLLEARLREKNRMRWMVEEFRLIEEKKVTYTETTYRDFRGFKKLSGTEQNILKHLFTVRKDIAKRINKPPYYIIGIRRLTELVTNPPKTLNDWRCVRGVHPIVRNEAKLFFDAVEQGRRDEVPQINLKRKQHTPAQKKKFQELSDIRAAIAQEQDVPQHLILNKDQMRDIVETGTLKSLRQWQRKPGS